MGNFAENLNLGNRFRPPWPYPTRTLASALRKMFGVQLYKNNARALLSRILSILNLDWLQHARSVRGVYESYVVHTAYRKCDRIVSS